VNSPPPKPEVILTNFFAEPTVLLVPISSRANTTENNKNKIKSTKSKAQDASQKIYIYNN
jgi:hypothetical protein